MTKRETLAARKRAYKRYIAKAMAAKRRWRREQAKLPIEEKMKQLRMMQERRYEIMKATGQPIPRHMIPWA